MWSAPRRSAKAPPRWPRNTTGFERNVEGPDMSDTAEILEQAARWREAGKGVALATVVNTWGSSPRPLGSQLAADSDGAFVGSIPGRCAEGAVFTASVETT